MRLTASQRPLIGPCFLSASRAYWLHVGVKRQQGGNRGEMHSLYSLMGRHSSHTAARAMGLRLLLVIGLLLEGGEDAAHGLLNACVWLEGVGYVNKCHVDARAVGQGVFLVEQAIGFAYATAHSDAVHGMAQALLGHGYEELDRGVALAAGVLAPYGAQRMGQGRRCAWLAAEQLADGCWAAELLFLVKPKHAPYALFSVRYRSMAAAIDGALTVGASRSRRRPASFTAWAVVAPRVAMAIWPCWKSGKFLRSESMPCGLKNTSMS